MQSCTVLDHCIVFVWIYLINIQSVVGVLPYSIIQKTSGYRSKGCPAGKYYNEETYERGKCRKCVICPKGYTEFSSCSTTTNRSCKPCKIGTTFSDKRGGICRNCTDCERGQFARRQCLPYRDTRCKNCPNGTYSLDRKGFGCKYCSVCKEHEEEVSPCTPLQNRECSLKEAIMSGMNAVIRKADMAEDMQQDATYCASQAIEKYKYQHEEEIRQKV